MLRIDKAPHARSRADIGPLGTCGPGSDYDSREVACWAENFTSFFPNSVATLKGSYGHS